MYIVRFNADAEKDLKLLSNKAPQALGKLAKLLDELKEHPRSGTGQCEQLKHYKEETWSRRITREHRLVYRIYDDIVEVLVISAFGHY
jgi:toxin YoeB